MAANFWQQLNQCRKTGTGVWYITRPLIFWRNKHGSKNCDSNNRQGGFEMTKGIKKRLKNIVYVDEKDFEGEEELCNALVAFIGRWKKKKFAECEKQRQRIRLNPISLSRR